MSVYQITTLVPKVFSSEQVGRCSRLHRLCQNNIYVLFAYFYYKRVMIIYCLFLHSDYFCWHRILLTIHHVYACCVIYADVLIGYLLTNSNRWCISVLFFVWYLFVINIYFSIFVSLSMYSGNKADGVCFVYVKTCLFVCAKKHPNFLFFFDGSSDVNNVKRFLFMWKRFRLIMWRSIQIFYSS